MNWQMAKQKQKQKQHSILVFFFFYLFVKAWTSKKCPSQRTCPSIRELLTNDVIPGTCQRRERTVRFEELMYDRLAFWNYLRIWKIVSMSSEYFFVGIGWESRTIFNSLAQSRRKRLCNGPKTKIGIQWVHVSTVTGRVLVLYTCHFTLHAFSALISLAVLMT